MFGPMETLLHLSQQLPSGSKQTTSVPLPADPMVFLPEGYILNLTKSEKVFSGSCQPKKTAHPISSHSNRVQTPKNHQARTETWIKHDKTIKLS